MNRKLTPRIVSEREWLWTILGLALFFGAFVRILPGVLGNFPINDGGMFAAAMRDLMAGGFMLPATMSYNFVDIPYAYPPVGFYFGAFLQLLGASELQVLLWLPIFLAVITLPLFYIFALGLMADGRRAAVATVFFALTPGTYVWFLMGGGLTRTFGAIFFMLAVFFVHRVFILNKIQNLICAVIFCALVVLSHPQYSYLTIISCAVIWLFYGRSRHGIFSAFFIILGTILVTFPWWWTVISRHGIELFLSTSQAGDLHVSIEELLRSIVSVQTILPFDTFFRLLGIGWAVYKKRFDLLILVVTPYFLDQRSAPIVAGFTYPMLAAYGFMDVLPLLVDWFSDAKNRLRGNTVVQTGNKLSDGFIYKHGLSMSLLGIIFYLTLESSMHAYIIRKTTLPYEAISMMAWVEANTDERASFLILTSRGDLMTDPVQEWFPVLAERHSATTVQGLEWILGGRFMQRWNELIVLQNCLDLNCVQLWEGKIKAESTQVILDKKTTAPELLTVFWESGGDLIYENQRYLIYKK